MAAPAAHAGSQRNRVWDLPTRVFHWLLVINFFVAYLTGDNDRWALIHITCGYTILGLILFRLVWGFVGTVHARFSSFIRKPSVVLAYLKGLVTLKPQHYSGHNPAGGWAIVLLLFLGIATIVTGWAEYEEFEFNGIEQYHQWLANGMLAVVFLHLAGVLVSSLIHRENLVRAMLDGCKCTCEGSVHHRCSMAVILLLVVSAYWIWVYRAGLLKTLSLLLPA